MSRKSEYLQIRVTPEQKTALRRAARRAGRDMSGFVLARLLPPARMRFEDTMKALGDDEEPSYALAALNDLLAGLDPEEFQDATAHPPLANLSDYLRNYVAAMVEQAAHQKRVAPSAWVTDVRPLEKPHFVEPLPGLRLHLLAAAPTPFRRRNIFVDSTVGDRI